MGAWLDKWAIMEKARIARQQAVQLNTDGWSVKPIEFWIRILTPDALIRATIKKWRERQNGETKRQTSKTEGT